MKTELDLIKLFEKTCLDKRYTKKLCVSPVRYVIQIGSNVLLLFCEQKIYSDLISVITFMGISQKISLDENIRLQRLHSENFYTSEIETQERIKAEELHQQKLKEEAIKFLKEESLIN